MQLRRIARVVIFVGLAALAVGGATGAFASGALSDDHYQAPFQTDADLFGYFNDTSAIVSHGGTGAQLVWFAYPDIQDVLVDGAALSVSLRYNGLIRAYLPEGAQLVTIRTSGNGTTAQYSPSAAIDTESEFNSAAALLTAGDELVVRNGYYLDWDMVIPADADGTEADPIVIRPETPGGVTFGYGSSVALRGDHVVLKGFRFEHAGSGYTAVMIYGSDCRMTQCQFFHCGNPYSTFTHISQVYNYADDNRVDHCFWTGSKSMSTALRGSTEAEAWGRRTRFDHNIFRDIVRFSYNGQENIQLGQGLGGGQDTCARPNTLIEYNLFNNAWGDGETISVKVSSNTIRYNVAVNNRNSFCFRQTEDNVFEGNVMYRSSGGLRMFRKGHKIVNNLFVDLTSYGVSYFLNDTTPPCSQTLVANNTFVNSGANGLVVYPGDPDSTRDNVIRDNIFAATWGNLIDPEFLNESTNTTIDNNVFWALDDANTGPTGTNAIRSNPRLEGTSIYIHPDASSPALDAAMTLSDVWRDRWGALRPCGLGPDIGAEEMGATGGAVVLPDIPSERPPFDFDAYKGRILASYNTTNPDDGWTTSGMVLTDGDSLLLESGASIELAAALPESFVMEWEFRPASFPSQLNLRFSEDEMGDAYDIEFGGSSYSDKPASIIMLSKAGTLVAKTADLQYHWMNYKDLSSTIDPNRWYKMRMIKLNGMIRLEMNCEKLRNEILPALVWHDAGQLAGAALAGTTLRFEQSVDDGYFRNIFVWDCRPQSCVAEQASGATYLAWQAEDVAAILNPDADDDVRSDIPTGLPESPAQTWIVVSDDEALGARALEAPPAPHKQMTDTDHPESIAVYRTRFATAGAYYLYFRAKNNGIPGHSSSDSFWRPMDFGTQNPTGNTDINQATGGYVWRQLGTLDVDPADLGKALELRFGVREYQTHLDAFVLSTRSDLDDATLDSYFGNAIRQEGGVNYVVVQAEDATEILNPDLANDVQANVARGFQEFPERTWEAVDCDGALNCRALRAPASPDRQQSEPPEPHESIAVYTIEFATTGTYTAYMRVRNNGVDGNNGSDSFWRPSDFNTTPTLNSGTGTTGEFDWKAYSGYVVEAADIGAPLEFRVGVRESLAHIDALVFSTDTGLSDAALDALATPKIVQESGASHVAFEAENASAILNPDAENDVQASTLTQQTEVPAAVWTAVCDAGASGFLALKAPSSPDYQRDNPEFPETIAVYNLEFATAGTYSAYFRVKNNGMEGNGGSDSFYRTATFATEVPATTVGIPKDGQYNWVKSGTYAVAAGDVGTILPLRIAVREPDAHIDAIVLSTNGSLSDAALDGYLNHAPAFLNDTIVGPSTTHITEIVGSLVGYADDADQGDVLTYSKQSGPAWLQVSSQGTLSGTPTFDDVGLNEFTVRVTDPSGAYGEATLQVTVTFAYTLSEQGVSDNYVAWQAEDYGLILNPDADNDVQNSVQTGYPESPERVWTVVEDNTALSSTALQAPPYPHKQMTDTDLQETIVVYYQKFATSGTYYGYFRVKNNGTPDHRSSDSFWRGADFGAANPSAWGSVSSTGVYTWMQQGAYAVDPADVGEILQLRCGVRESDAHIDAVVLSTQSGLSEAELNALF